MRFLSARARQPDERRSLLRASVALLYAHWEGFIKEGSLVYLEYVKWQRLTNRDLSKNFLALSARSKLRAIQQSDGISAHLALAEFFLNEMSSRCDIPVMIGTKANLSSIVLREIVLTLGLDFSEFSTKANLIDERLLDKRNTVAHGEYLLIEENDYEQLQEQVLWMLDRFRTQIENAIALKKFLSNPRRQLTAIALVRSSKYQARGRRKPVRLRRAMPHRNKESSPARDECTTGACMPNAMDTRDVRSVIQLGAVGAT